VTLWGNAEAICKGC